jgi:iron complex outermembrane recepter protein
MTKHTLWLRQVAAGGPLCMLAGIMAVPPVVLAQGADNPRVLEEITVTARKREERLLDVPVAVTAISAERIEAQSMSRLDDVTYAVPNLSISGGGTDAGGTGFGIVYVRGIGQIDYANSIDPGVGTYVDGVYLGRAVGGNLDLPDIQQVEVLRGPQGTLFGKNTMGGAINVTTKRPTFENDATFAITYGEDNRMNGEFEGDLKLSDTVAARVVGAYRSQDGYISRYYGGDAIGEEDTLVGRAKLEYRPSDDLDVLVSFDYTDAGGTSAKTVKLFDPLAVGDQLAILWNEVPAAFAADLFDNGMIDGSQPPIPGLPFVPYSVIEGERIGPQNDFNDLRTNAGTGPMKNDFQSWGASARIEWDFGPATLRSITAYRTLDSVVGGDQDGQRANASVAYWGDEQSQWSQEFNLYGSTDSLDWLAGLYYFSEDADASQEIRQNLPWFMVNILFGTETKSYAAFAEGTWRFSERWSAVAGVRYTSEDKDFYAHDVCYPGMVLPCPGGEFLPLTTTSDSWTSVDPRVGLQYRPSTDWLLYVQYSSGFKSGGFNARPGSIEAARQPFDMEQIDAFEVGAKGSFAGGRAIVSLAAFYYDYTDLQMVISGINPLTGTAVAVVGNLGNATIKGAEAEITWRPVDRLLLNAAVGYTNAEYDSLDPGVLDLITAVGSPAVTLDNKLPRTPEWTVNAGIEYLWTLGASGDLTARLDYAWIDEQFNDIQNFREAMTPSHENVNARITYRHSDRWEAALYARNLTDEEYVANSFWPQGGQASVLFLIPNEPREVGLTLKFHF